jgi:hypothetical protein
VFVHFDAEDRVRQFYLANGLAIQIDYIYDRHIFSRSLNLVCFSSTESLLYFAFFAAFLDRWMKMY